MVARPLDRTPPDGVSKIEGSGEERNVRSRARWGIRAHLSAVLIAGMLPLAVLLGYEAFVRFGQHARQAREDQRAIAHAIAPAIGAMIEGNRDVLSKLAARPGMDSEVPARCDPLFSELQRLGSNLANVVVTNRAGEVVCSATPLPADRQTGIGSMPHFRRMLETGRFTLSEPFVGPVTGRWVVAQIHPRTGPDGRIVGGIGIPLDLTSLGLQLARMVRDPNAKVYLVSAAGRLVAASDARAVRIGTDILGTSLAQAISQPGTSTFDARDLKGAPQLFGTAPVAGTSWTVLVGVPREIALAPAFEQLRTAIVVLVAAILLALAGSVMVAQRIAAPILSLGALAKRIASGARDVRLEMTGARELAEAAAAVNQMLAVRERAEDSLRASEQRYRQLFEANPQPMWVYDVETLRFLAVNDAAVAHYGYSRDEFFSMTVADIRPPEDVPALLRGGVHEATAGIKGSGVWRHRKKDGALIDVEITTHMLEFDGRRAKVVLAFDITERNRAERELRDYGERLRGLSRRLVEVEETERRNINRELHDRVGQNLGALNINLNLIRSQLPQESAPAVDIRFRDTQRLLEETAVQIRNVMTDLHPPALDEYGLLAALHNYVQAFGARIAIPVIVQGEDLAPRLPRAAEMALFRIAQGALANAVAHARAQRIEITLDATTGGVMLIIADDGVGFDPALARQARANWGLTIMRERAEAVGATLRIDSAPGRGTRVVVEIGREAA